MPLLLRLLTAFLFLLGAAPAVAQNAIELTIMPGQVSAAHAKLEPECTQCHKRFNASAQDGLCLDCHKEVKADVNAKKGFHGKSKRETCKSCHTEHKGRKANIVALNEKTFDHKLTDYELRGAHAKVKCASCHLPKLKHREAPHDCLACHKKDDVHKGGLGANCAKCHTEKDWKDVAAFDHSVTRFALKGKHADTKCKECHVDGKYKDLPMTCVSCHKKDDDRKGHKGQYGEKCQTCHSEREWKPSTFDHNRDTDYALRGKHITTKCTACHTGNLYKQELGRECVSCHKKDDKHKGELGTQCASCHVERNWKDSRFDHGKTRFALTGKHADAECKACHTNGHYKDAPMDCFSCHKKDDDKNGHKGQYGEKCETCHRDTGWKPSTFNHDRDTKYPLRAKHAQAKCADCHTGHLYKQPAPKECYACHKKDDEKTGHKGQYGEKCETCHLDTGWKPSTFNHDRDTKYPLRAKHAQVKCADCHTGHLYKQPAPKECFACHKKDDKHEGQLGQGCESCHAETGWKEVTFDHNKSRFPLLGSHAVVKCDACHKTQRFRDAPRVCAGCHQKDDVHKTTLGKKCETCHNNRNWAIWDFNHDKQTKFALTGSHKPLKCAACHKLPSTGDSLVSPGRECIACHRGDDAHNGNFGSQCDRCHVSTKWTVIKPGGRL
jgi:hypothetical protein